jgi:hypothetical protein
MFLGWLGHATWYFLQFTISAEAALNASRSPPQPGA